MARRANNGPGKAEAPPETPQAAAHQRVNHQDLAERVGLRVGNFTSRTLRGVLRVIGRVREEAEDVWAEAQALRQRETAPKTAPAGEAKRK